VLRTEVGHRRSGEMLRTGLSAGITRKRAMSERPWLLHCATHRSMAIGFDRVALASK
jgi:hypothetical protein